LDFPDYVPQAARERIALLLEGDANMPGRQDLLDNDQRRLAELESEIERIARAIRQLPDQTPSAYHRRLDELRREKAERLSHLAQIKREVEFLRRLALDDRMRDAYALLAKEFTDDQQWRSFIYAAWSAHIDFAKYRERRKNATELTKEIAETAKKLSALLRQFSALGVGMPEEFFSIPELLRQTDNHDGRNLYMWREMRKVVLGEEADEKEETKEEKDNDDSNKPEENGKEFELSQGDNSTQSCRVIVKRKNIKQTEKMALRYAWTTAPEFSELLDTLAEAARSFDPKDSGMVEAASGSRKRNQKNEYLRALLYLLIDVHGFAITEPIMKAIAIVTTVAIDSPDVVATYSDVKNALTWLNAKRLERE